MNQAIEFIKILVKNLPRGIIPGFLVIIYKRLGRDIKFLVIKTLPSGSIAFPGGTISWWENYEQAAKRELYEETGIKAKKIEVLPFIHKFRYDHLPLKLKCEQHVYLYEVGKSDKTKLRSNETEWFKWVTKKRSL